MDKRVARNFLESIFVSTNNNKSKSNNDGKNEEIHFAFIQRNNFSRNLLPKLMYFQSRDMHLLCYIYI